ncbi:MAG: sensor histidine kinase [Bacilli bacterium]
MRPSLKFSTKIWLVFVFMIGVLVTSVYWFTDYSYRNLYVKELQRTLSLEVDRYRDLYKQYDRDRFRESIAIANGINDEQVIFIEQKEGASGVTEIVQSHRIVLSEEEIAQLEVGRTILREGFETSVQQAILGAITPLRSDEGVEAMLYIYVTKASLYEFIDDEKFMFFFFLIIIVGVFISLGFWMIRQLTRPLVEMKDATHRIARGDYSVRLYGAGDDEFGHLSRAFNGMAASIEREDERQREFLQNVSHELRTPLSHLKGYSELLLDESTTSTERRAYANVIYRETERMQRLVHDLLDLARLEGEPLVVAREPIGLAQAVWDTITLYPEFQHNPQIFHLELDDSLIVDADYDRMTQVVRNLVDNALKYRTGNTQIHISLEEKEGVVWLDVFNFGVPVDAATQKQVGERFLRAAKDRARKSGGVGLGLAIVKQIVKRHDGEFLLFAENEGTRARVILSKLA